MVENLGQYGIFAMTKKNQLLIRLKIRQEVTVEIYLSRQKEETLVIDTNLEYYNDDCLTAINNALEKRTDKKVSLENVMELARSVLKTTYLNIWQIFQTEKKQNHRMALPLKWHQHILLPLWME